MRVVRDSAEAHLLLVGAEVDRNYAESLRREITGLNLARDVTILGPRDDVAAVLHACDIGVLSSASEGLPLALLEYGWSKLATVVTRVGQCPDVVDHGRCGLLVSPGDPDALAAAILQLLANNSLKHELSEGLARRVRDVYSAEAALKRLDQIYTTILADQW
jgi:glycosyltransferase involved in cell wall biosynthesis